MALPEEKCCLSKRVVILSLVCITLLGRKCGLSRCRLMMHGSFSHVVSSGIGVFVVC